MLESAVYDIARQYALNVIHHAIRGTNGREVNVAELVVSNGENYGIVLLVRKLRLDADTIFVLNSFGVSPRVVYVDVMGVFAKGVIDVHHLSVADIGTVLLERDAEDENLGVLDEDAFLVHTLDNLIGNIVAHAVIQAA